MNPFEDISNLLFGYDCPLFFCENYNAQTANAMQMQASEDQIKQWAVLHAVGLANSEEAIRYNERGKLSIAKSREIKNKIYVYDDVQ